MVHEANREIGDEIVMEMIEYVIEMLETEMMEYVIEMQKEMLDIPYYRYYHLHCDLCKKIEYLRRKIEVHNGST